MGEVSLNATEKRALKILLSGPVEYHVHGSKATDWRKGEWKFNIATLRGLQQLDLADYVITASCRRTWTLTIEGRRLCLKLGLSPVP